MNIDEHFYFRHTQYRQHYFCSRQQLHPKRLPFNVLEYRLKQVPLLQWHDILRGLRSSAVHEQVLASQIECQYIPCSSSQAQPVSDQSCLNSCPEQGSAPYLYSNQSFPHSGLVASLLQSHPPVTAKQLMAPRPSATRQPHLETDISLPMPHDSKALFNQFIQYVKILYKSSPVEKRTEVLKLATPGEVYVNLACIDRKTEGLRTKYDEITEAMVRDGNVDVIEGRKCPIDMNKIAFDLPSEKRLVVIEGAPGVGKSTFAWEFCRRWERGEIAQQYNLVLLLPLRDECISRATQLQDLIFHSSKMVSSSVVSELEITHGSNILLLLEGYDELPGISRRSPSLFLDLINGKLLPQATIMVTSRPWATCDLIRDFTCRIYQHVEVMGFTNDQITTFFEKNMPSVEAKKILHYINSYPMIRKCMYTPLNCAILRFVYLESKEVGATLPSTLTELYFLLTRIILLRYLRSTDSSVELVTNFEELHPHVRGIFYNLCEVAYKSIVEAGDQVKLIFTDLPADFNSLGFMDSVFEFYATRRNRVSHNFLHLTFQEFLAAVYISNMESCTRVKFFKRSNEGKLRVVLRFIPGLTNLKDFSSSTQFIEVLDDSDEDECYYSVSSQLSWVYEAKKEKLIRDTFGKDVTVEFTCNDFFDSSALGYCIANSCCNWVLSIARMVSEDDVHLMINEINTANSHSPVGVIVGLSGAFDECIGICEGLSISLEGLNVLFAKLHNVHLQQLALILPTQ